MSTPTITEFLEARIAEDEREALDAPQMTDVYDADRAAFTPSLRTRVLAECAAKRALVEEHSPVGGWCVACERETPCPSIRIVSAVYAAHPDYQQGWKL